MSSADRRALYLANRPHATDDTLAVTDTYSGDVVARTGLANARDIEAAIRAGVDARPATAALAPDARRDVLLHCVRRFEERAEELAQTVCSEAGKPIREARGEVVRLIDTFRIAAEEATRLHGDVLELQVSPRARGYRGMTRRVPVGLCSFITPFNFPLNLVAHKVAPAIAAGCPFILKPALTTPLSALLIGEILAETDLPPGAFSILPCSNETAAPLVEDPRIALLSFTGGPVGWELKARAGRKKVTLELGGNAACIVDADPGADIAHIVERLVTGGYAQSGQSCISVQRILVHASRYAAVRDALIAAVSALRVGDPRDPATTIGPLIDEAAAIRIETWIAEATAGGARVLVGGTRHGNRLPAHLLEDVPTDGNLYRREVFGPVALLEAFGDFDDALARVNGGDYGLQAGVFTGSLQHAMQAWDRLEVGGVIVGDVPSVRIDAMPYGGVKASGRGREGVHHAIAAMTEERLLVIRTPNG